MKRNYLDLIFAVVGLFIVINNYMAGNPTKDFFGAEIPSIMYRGLWSAFSIVGFVRFFKASKNHQN